MNNTLSEEEKKHLFLDYVLDTVVASTVLEEAFLLLWEKRKMSLLSSGMPSMFFVNICTKNKHAFVLCVFIVWFIRDANPDARYCSHKNSNAINTFCNRMKSLKTGNCDSGKSVVVQSNHWQRSYYGILIQQSAF